MTMVHLSRLAEDFIILCGEEHRFFELSDALSTGSSMMPQKKNPDPLELVRGKTGRSIGHLVALLTTMKGLPSGYNKDLQEDKEAIFDAEDTLAGCLATVRAVVSGLTLDRERAARAASGMLLATDVADYLVRRGVPFRRAHEVVGGAGPEARGRGTGVRFAVDEGVARGAATSSATTSSAMSRRRPRWRPNGRRNRRRPTRSHAGAGGGARVAGGSQVGVLARGKPALLV